MNLNNCDIPKCVFQWRSSVRWSMNFLAHFSHWYGFDFECVSIWVFKALFPLNEFLQIGQIFRFKPEEENNSITMESINRHEHLNRPVSIDYPNGFECVSSNWIWLEIVFHIPCTCGTHCCVGFDEYLVALYKETSHHIVNIHIWNHLKN